jgi:hypothetical protein
MGEEDRECDMSGTWLKTCKVSSSKVKLNKQRSIQRVSMWIRKFTHIGEKKENGGLSKSVRR